MKSFTPRFAEIKEIKADLAAFQGVSHFQLGNFKEARQSFHEQLELCHAAKLEHQIPRCLENMGRAYAKLGDYQSAKEALVLVLSDSNAP